MVGGRHADPRPGMQSVVARRGATKQSISPKELDCVASLAMTEVGSFFRAPQDDCRFALPAPPNRNIIPRRRRRGRGPSLASTGRTRMPLALDKQYVPPPHGGAWRRAAKGETGFDPGAL